VNIINKTSEIVSSDIGFEICNTEDRCNLLVVLLHGYGSSGDDLISLVPYLKADLAGAYWFAPNAIQAMPVFGYQWFDYVGDDIEKMQSGIANARGTILDLIDKKRNLLGLSNDKVCLIGFSQGGMVAIDLALSVKNPFACAISFSGALIPHKNEHLIHKGTSICLIHGEEDQVVPFYHLGIAREKLTSLGCKVESHAIAHLAHSIDMKGLQIAKDFLLKNAGY
jgi:phospholipase/carboxylesterase